MASEQIEVEVVAKFDEAITELRKLTSQFDKSFSQIEQNTSNASKAFSSFVGNLAAGLAIKALDTFTNAANGLFQTFIVDGIRAASEQEAAINSLNQSLAAAGEFTQKASEDFQKFASELENTTKFSDDAIIKNAALLESLSQLDEQGLKRATKASADLASALGISLEEAVTKVGKAAQGEVTALNKYGLAIRKGKDDAETFSNALNALEGRFGGRAQGDLNTFAGSIARLGNIFNNLQEEVGNVVIKNGSLIAVFNVIGDVLREVSALVNENAGSLRAGFTAAIITTIDVLNLLIISFDSVGRTLSTINEILTQVGNTALNTFSSLSKALKGDFSGALQDFKRGLQESDKQINETFNQTTNLEKLSEGLFRIKNAAESSFDSVGESALKAGQKIKDLTEAQKKLQEQANKIAEDARRQQVGGNKQEQDLKTFQEAFDQRLITEQTYYENVGILQQNADLAEVDRLIAKNEMLAQLDADKNAAEIQANQNQIDTLLAVQKDGDEKVQAERLKAANAEKKINDAKRQKELKDQETFLSTTATLASANNQTLAAIGKAAAITQIAIKTPEAVASSFAFGARIGGPPLGFVFGAIAATAMAVQAAKIAGVALATGIDSVPGTGTRDNFPAILAPGERVVPRRTNQDLTQFLSGNNDTNQILGAILDRLGRLENNVTVNIGSKEIIEVVNTGIREGRVLAS